MNEELSSISSQNTSVAQEETHAQTEPLEAEATETEVQFPETSNTNVQIEEENAQPEAEVEPIVQSTEAVEEVPKKETHVSPTAEAETEVQDEDTKTDVDISSAKEKSSKSKTKSKSKSKSKTKLRRSKTKSSSSEPIVTVKDVSVIFNIANEKIQSLKEYFIKMTKRELMFRKFVAVDNVSFQVNKGDVFGLVGTNGSGKSTLLKVVAGVLEPSTGTCTVNGTISPLIELGAGFDMELTARENIYLNGALLGLSKKFIDEQIDEIINFAELHDFMEMPLKNYSSGMVARIAFAIATTTEPDLLIVDEVLSVGDFLFQEKCEKRISKMIKHGTTVLIVSHNIKQIDRLCNRAMWIEKSQMRMIGKAKEVCKAYKHFEGSE